jgi:trehalose 6-phosphate phosphatase
MTTILQDALDRLRWLHRHGGSLVLLFDYDGTLTPIVDHPQLAVLDPEMRRLLSSLAARPRVHVGILSGRRLDELKSFVEIPGLYLAGTGGLELELRGVRVAPPHSDQIAGTVERLAEQLEEQLPAYPGAWLERKGLGLTVHYRHAPSQLLDSLQAAVAEVVRMCVGRLRIVPGPKAWEITPVSGWSKGTAIRMILADCGAVDEVLFYAGDGTNDVQAVEEVAAMGGITLGIGPDAPFAAQYRLPDPAALRMFLGDLDASLKKRASSPARPCARHAGLNGQYAIPMDPM